MFGMPILAVGKTLAGRGAACTLDGVQQVELAPAKQHTRAEDYALRKKIYKRYVANKDVRPIDLDDLGLTRRSLTRYLTGLRALDRAMYEKNPENVPLCLVEILERGGRYKYMPWLNFFVAEGIYACTMKDGVPYYAPAGNQSNTPPVKHRSFADVVEGMCSGKRKTRKQTDKSQRLDILYQAYKEKVQAWAVATETPIGYLPRTVGKYLKAFRELDDIVGKKWVTESEILESSHNILCITKAVLEYCADKGHYTCKEEDGTKYYKKSH